MKYISEGCENYMSSLYKACRLLYENCSINIDYYFWPWMVVKKS